MGKTYTDFSQLSKDEKTNLIGREFVHFKMRLPRSDQVDRRSEATEPRSGRKSPRGHYRLEGFAKDSETLEEMVVYRALYMHPRFSVGFPDEQREEFSRSENRKRVREGGLWVRPAKMFFETIQRDGKTMRRFELVEDKSCSR